MEINFFCEVDEDFIDDEFNLYGLSDIIPHYELALDTILKGEQLNLDEKTKTLVENDAKILYGLIHARYIVSIDGLRQMYEKFKHGDFGGCPRVLCKSHSVLPVGVSDAPFVDHVKLFCPKCNEIYSIPAGFIGATLDGAYFGTTFPHLLLLSLRGIQTEEHYQPKVFGFDVWKKSAPQGFYETHRRQFYTYEN
ncbi:Casein kinase II subunit beta [Entamoeba marina]